MMAVVEDWARKAAKKIWQIAFEYQGLVPPEKVIYEVIAEHCPMKQDVAYMEVPRCATCAYWQREGSFNDVGICNYIGNVDYCKIWPDLYDRVHTEATFGCIEWKER